MKHARTSLLFAVSLALALLIAACGSSTTSGSGGGPYGGGSTSKSTPTSSTGSSSAVTLKTATLTVGGKSMVVLTNAQGMTLYYRTSDTPTSVCSGGCASAWPPVLSQTTPSVSAKLPGTLSLLKDANGSQVTYNGHPLYTSPPRDRPTARGLQTSGLLPLPISRPQPHHQAVVRRHPVGTPTSPEMACMEVYPHSTALQRGIRAPLRSASGEAHWPH